MNKFLKLISLGFYGTPVCCKSQKLELKLKEQRNLVDTTVRENCSLKLECASWQSMSKKLAMELESMCNSIDAWEQSVESVIGRKPESGIFTKEGKRVVNEYLQKRSSLAL